MEKESDELTARPCTVHVTFSEDISIRVENVLVSDMEEFTQELLQRCVNAYKAKQILDAISSGHIMRAINLFNSCGDCPVAKEIAEENLENAETQQKLEVEEENKSYQ